jgi:F5/8 type C domain
MDMVQEFVTWFQWKGSPVYEVTVQVQAAMANYAAEWLTPLGLPLPMAAPMVGGQEANAYVEVKNVGARAWPASGADAMRLGYRWLDMQGQEVAVTGARTYPLPRTIEPGEKATFRDVTYATPEAPGAYRLVWDLVQSETWLSTLDVAVQERPLQIVPPEYGVGWSVLEPWPGSPSMPPAQEERASLHLRNTGTRTWAADGEHPVQLATHWFTADGKLTEPWDTFHSRLPHDVPPGSTVDLIDVPFRTPPVLGRYTLRWDLVEEGKAWFFRQGGAPLELTVEVSDRAVFAPWQAQASHNAEDAAMAFDGNPDTMWDSRADQQPGMWLQVDLGQVLELDRVRALSPGRGFPAGYQVQLSVDGQGWHLVAEKADNFADVDVAFAPCSARYLRLEQTGRPEWPATWMVSEIAVSATPRWAGARASHYLDDASKAIDARLQTAWTTRAVKQRPGMWFELDMGSLRLVERVTLVHPSNLLPRGYAVQVSADASNWQEVGREDDNWTQVDVPFAPGVARYIRVETTNRSETHSWGISEFVVWRSSPTWLRGRGG